MGTNGKAAELVGWVSAEEQITNLVAGVRARLGNCQAPADPAEALRFEVLGLTVRELCKAWEEYKAGELQPRRRA